MHKDNKAWLAVSSPINNLSGVFSTPNPGVFDEKVCTHVLTALTHSVRPVTTADIPCVLGSDTECMTQVIYE